MKFEIIKSDITNISADAIVLPANTRLKEGSGVSTALFKAAGRKELTKACREIGYCELGYAVPTPAFNLKAKYIIHTVVPKWIDGNHNEYEYLSSAYFSALRIADYFECQSIALPLLASGNNGFDLELALEIARESIDSFEGRNLKKVNLIIYGSRIATLILNRGWIYSENPVEIEKQEAMRLRQEKRDHIKVEAQDLAEKAAVALLAMAKEYWKDERNRQFVKDMGKRIVKVAYAKIVK